MKRPMTRPKISQFARVVALALCLMAAFLLLGSACLPKPEPPPPEPPKNQSPAIKSLTAEPIANPAGKYQVTCTASDPEGDTLEYWWTADGGMIEGTGSNITWIAPEAGGIHNVKVMVRDKEGAEATQSVAITAASTKNNPPVITKMTIDAKDAQDLNTIKIWITANIYCLAEDPDGGKLTYMWSATGGEIKGEDAIVQWIAPGISGDHIVRVRVIDDRGAEAESTLNFHVKCCGR